MSSSFKILSAFSIFAVTSACSFNTLEVENCDTTTQCREAFGLGSTCASNGLCEQLQKSERCTETFPLGMHDDKALVGDRIIIGNLMDRTSTTHQARERSARLALKLANDEGGTDGRALGSVFCTIEENPAFDTLTRTEAAVAASAYLAQLGVPAIVGPAASSDTQAVFLDLTDKARDVLVISPSATSPTLSELDPAIVDDQAPGLLWRTAPPDTFQASAIVADMRDPGAGRIAIVNSVAVIYEAGPYGEGLAVRFQDEFQSAGGTTELHRFDNDGQRNQAVTDVGLGAVEEVLFVSSQFTDVVAFLDSAASIAGYDTKTIFLTDAAANQDVLSNADPARFAAIRGTRPAPLDETVDLVYANFLVGYSAEYGEDVKPFSFTANAYDAAWLVAYGVTWSLFQESDALSGTTIARGLRQLSAGEAVEILPTSWQLIQNRFRDGNSVDISGASGQLDYDPATEETVSDIEIWDITASAVSPVYVWVP